MGPTPTTASLSPLATPTPAILQAYEPGDVVAVTDPTSPSKYQEFEIIEVGSDGGYTLSNDEEFYPSQLRLVVRKTDATTTTEEGSCAVWALGMYAGAVTCSQTGMLHAFGKMCRKTKLGSSITQLCDGLPGEASNAMSMRSLCDVLGTPLKCCKMAVTGQQFQCSQDGFPSEPQETDFDGCVEECAVSRNTFGGASIEVELQVTNAEAFMADFRVMPSLRAAVADVADLPRFDVAILDMRAARRLAPGAGKQRIFATCAARSLKEPQALVVASAPLERSLFNILTAQGVQEKVTVEQVHSEVATFEQDTDGTVTLATTTTTVTTMMRSAAPLAPGDDFPPVAPAAPEAKTTTMVHGEQTIGDSAHSASLSALVLILGCVLG